MIRKKQFNSKECKIVILLMLIRNKDGQMITQNSRLDSTYKYFNEKYVDM